VSFTALLVFTVVCVLLLVKLAVKKPRDSSTDWWAWYNAYLRSAEWKMKRKGVLLRCGGRCERCAKAIATDVHHLPGSYARIPHELPWDLAALCYDCHKAQHPGKRF
jgi:5-methylcytosine-specific restriction endonuclease McrA